jgi:hypothetical protein
MATNLILMVCIRGKLLCVLYLDLFDFDAVHGAAVFHKEHRHWFITELSLPSFNNVDADFQL